MASASKKEAVSSKMNSKTAKASYVSCMATPNEGRLAAEVGRRLAEETGAAIAKSEEKTAEGVSEGVREGMKAAAPMMMQQNPQDPKVAAQIAREWAQAEIAAEETKLSLRQHNPKAVELIFLIILAGIFILGMMAESEMWKTVLLILTCFLFVTKNFLFEYLRERIHIPEHIDAVVILNVLIATLIIWLEVPFAVGIIFMIVAVCLSQYGPYLWDKINTWRKARKKEKSAQDKELDDRTSSVGKNAMIYDILDFVIGWVPLGGDLIGFGINMIIPIRSFKYISLSAFFKMLVINAIDFGLGLFPVIGDAIDLVSISNVLNSGILKQEIDRRTRGIEEKGRGFWVLLFIFLMFIFLIIYAAPIMANYGGWVGTFGTSMNRMTTGVREALIDFNPIESIKGWYTKQLAIATGDYYVGTVDDNAKTQLGVYLEDIKQADPVFYTDRDIIMYALLKVQTLDNPINVTLFCNTTGIKPGADPAQLFPQKFFEVDLYEEQEIDCRFKPGTVDKGMWTFELGAEFDFKTLSYLKSYFMDSERLRGMRRENIDPLDQYGITDKNPVGVYTNGPVEIGMRIGNLPIGLDLEQPESSLTLGITISNKWQGDVIKMNRIILILPKGFILQEIGAYFTEVGCTQLPAEEMQICDDSFNTVYIINDETFPKVAEGQFKSYRAFLKVDRDNYEKVLGLNPVATKYFKVTADYTYRMKKTKIIEIKSRERAVLPGIGVSGGGVDMTPPMVENFKQEIISPGTVKLTWETDEESNDQFSYLQLPSGSSISTPSESGLKTEHERTLENLAAGKSFQYTIEPMDANGNKGRSQGVFNS